MLLEAQRIGRGSTAASTALLMQEPDVDFGDLAGATARAGARRLANQPAGGAERSTRAGCPARGQVDRPSLYFTRREAPVRARGSSGAHAPDSPARG